MTGPRRGHVHPPQALPGADEASISNRKVDMRVHCFFGGEPANGNKSQSWLSFTSHRPGKQHRVHRIQMRLVPLNGLLKLMWRARRQPRPRRSPTNGESASIKFVADAFAPKSGEGT